MDDIPPPIPPDTGRERYYRTGRRRVHKLHCPYAKKIPLYEWTTERGRSWKEINDEAESNGKVIFWCMRCFPRAHPAIRAGYERQRVGHKILFKPVNEIS